MLIKSYSGKVMEAGCDEAGRGCLAGPVVAAAVILPEGYLNSKLKDSKKLSETNRNILREEIENSAPAWAIGMADPGEIDRMNILNASILAMHRALSQLVHCPEYVIVDGNRFKNYENVPHTCIVKGDSLYMSIAAASVLAKTHRDAIMMELHKEFLQYGWDRNKGYPTSIHAEALRRYGPTCWHRMSFRLKARQMKINFIK